MRPTYAAAAVVTFMNAWNSYLWPLVIMQKPESKTMPLLVADLTAGGDRHLCGLKVMAS